MVTRNYIEIISGVMGSDVAMRNNGPEFDIAPARPRPARSRPPRVAEDRRRPPRPAGLTSLLGAV